MGILADLRRHPRRTARSFARRALGRATNRQYVELEYPPSAVNAPRYGHGRPAHAELARMVAAADDRFAAALDRFADRRDDLARIATRATDPAEPAWSNLFLPGLDGAALYCFVRDRRPARYLEIGSGNSTKFVVRAVRDEGAATRVTSIDPHPRAEIDALCDEVIRTPLESTDLAVFGTLGEGDVLFFDGSHRTFMNSDVVAFFLDVLPGLAPGVLVGVHDVYLPDDYPPDIADRYYSEQYMLAAYLLGGAPVELEFAAHHAWTDPQLRARVDALWAPGGPVVPAGVRHGVSFWFSTR